MIIECEPCEGSGAQECVMCWGEGVVDNEGFAAQCEDCNGEGEVDCFDCNGHGDVEAADE